MAEQEKNKARIYIIEDEALVARELKTRLIGLGYDVVGMAFGTSGLMPAVEARPDLLLSDINLRDGDGIELAAEINRRWPVPVVFLTAYSDHETVARAKQVAPYGYIVKPAENRELEITIEIALYKFSMERELKQTQALLSNALTCIGDALVFVDDDGAITQLNERARSLFGRAPVGEPWYQLLGLSAGSSGRQSITGALAAGAVKRIDPILVGAAGQQCMVDGLAGPMETGGVFMLREMTRVFDTPESAPSREDVEANIAALVPHDPSIVELLIAPDREVGSPETLAAVEETLHNSLRATDLLSRRGESTFSASLPYTSASQGRHIAEQVHRTLDAQAFTTIEGEPLTFSVGVAHSEPGNQQPIELFTEALRALNAARDSGGDRVLEFSQAESAQAPGVADDGRDYQNLLLLWNVMNVVGKTGDPESVNDRICAHFVNTFQLRGAVFLVNGETGIECQSHEVTQPTTLGFGEAHFRMCTELLKGGRVESAVEDDCLYSLELRQRPAVLLLSGCEEMRELDHGFVRTLLDYFGTSASGFDLPPPVAGAEPEDEFVYRSPQMRSLMRDAGLVAETDATVLITGESGTGKEMIARSIHGSSERQDEPLVIVDCGAVSRSLIDSELFGHVRGAFTGADRAFAGRLKEADGGTILLDEVGELPLDVQVKLLRFVQERQIVAVGSSQYVSVDTRVIAATNRNLQALVEAGEFRGDLFYRLNVFSIQSPPLRERGDDVLHLAEHFLRRETARQKKRIVGFTEEATTALMTYAWPGNVRELINLITRSVILCRDTHIGTIHLGLFPDAMEIREESLPGVLTDRLADALLRVVTRCIDADEYPPVGQWLEEDLIDAANEAAGQVMAQAASRLQMPETTLRRKLHRLNGSRAERPEYWLRVRTLLPAFLEDNHGEGLPVCDRASHLLLEILLRESPNRTDGSRLMGVSPPTYRRMLAAI